MSSGEHEASRVLRERDYRWEGTEEEAYKAEGTHFSGARRQTLVGRPAGQEAPAFETRYFEVEPGGYTTLERHEHTHVVIVVRGHAEVVLDDRVEPLTPLDCVYIAPHAWHQIHATGANEPLGFLCIVDSDRDRPQRPDADDLARLCADPAVARRIRT
ncbi:cupin domain-containing protein [Halorhodospira halophila]|uniref:Cupin 2, conserved barrel domain protein n=1 Tax=Halorhodospira halophila (strain DSM 244 / SL1) TaxID=349124 RepID=A1WU94_HALHL|nr:cupin domain-containing protein [Halorhodospira halophila]ABM61256.1 Cupin 2, conserved barrel domain protein [Halorhodospira halophila SL1]MBK1730012.1 cupin domain-containing protein [Halorhodospira halophila]